MVCSILKTTGLIDKYALSLPQLFSSPSLVCIQCTHQRSGSARRLRGAGPSSHIKGCSLGTPYPLLE